MLNIPVHWRIRTSLDESPFAAGQAGRPLRIVIDDVTAPDSIAITLLRSFDRRATVEIYGTAPDGARRVVIGTPDERNVIPVEYVLPDGGGRRMAILSSNSWISRSAELTAAEFGLPLEEASRALTLATACSRHDVDVLVTASPVLQVPYWRNLRASAHAGTPEEAAALLGLHLRAHNDFTINVDGNHATFLEDRRFYPAAALATLPHYLVWLGGAVATWRTGKDPTPYALLRGLEIRLGRALRARDYFNVRIRNVRPDDTWDEALFFFEAALLSLNGALDAAARCCHLGYELSGKPINASWAREGWRSELGAAAPELTQLLDPIAGPLIPCRTLVGVLRNYIHGEALSQELHRAEEGPETMDYGAGALAVAPSDGRRLLEAAQALGGHELWGLQEQYDAVVLVLPVQFLHRAIPTALRALDELMASTDPGRLGPPSGEPQIDPRYWLPDTGHEEHLRLLAGLDPRTR